MITKQMTAATVAAMTHPFQGTERVIHRGRIPMLWSKAVANRCTNEPSFGGESSKSLVVII